MAYFFGKICKWQDHYILRNLQAQGLNTEFIYLFIYLFIYVFIVIYLDWVGQVQFIQGGIHAPWRPVY